jgi:hypothetical protein
MATKVIDVSDAQEQLCDILAQVPAGTEIILVADYTLLTQLVSIALSNASHVPDLHKSSINMTRALICHCPMSFGTGELLQVIGYIRVSAEEQDLATQEIQIHDFIQVEISSRRNSRERRIDALLSRLDQA